MTENLVAKHYDILINEGNDPVHDPAPLKAYMDKWDGQEFIDKMLISINPKWKHYSLEQKNTILHNNIELRIENNTLKSNYNLSNL